MKHLYKILGAGLVLGALLIAGCAQEKKSAPNLNTASADVQAKAGVALSNAFEGIGTALYGTTDGVVVTDDSSGSNYDFTLTFTNYDLDGDGNTITGSMHLTGTFTSSTEVNLKESGSLVVSGPHAATVSFSLTIKGSGGAPVASGSVTVDGTEYSFSETMSSGT